MSIYSIDKFEEGLFKATVRQGKFKDHVIGIRDIKILEDGTADVDYCFLTKIKEDEVDENEISETLQEIMNALLQKSVSELMSGVLDNVEM